MKHLSSKGELKTIEFWLDISADEYLKYYQGHAQTVHVRSICGKNLQFPANLLREHVQRSGIKGRFILYYQVSGKAVKLVRCC